MHLILKAASRWRQGQAEMRISFRSALVLACAACVICGCGEERTVAPRMPHKAETSEQPLGKLAVDGNAATAVVVATVLEDDAPLGGVAVAFARSISGRAPVFSWADTTDANGRARVNIDEAGGYYQVRATLGGNHLGSWSSIPVNRGQRVSIDLPIGGTARVTDAFLLAPGRLPAVIRVGVVLPFTGDGGPLGQIVRNGMELARDEVNRYELGSSTLEFIVEDSESSPDEAATSFEKLIYEDNLTVILGPGYSSSAAVAFPIAQENRVVAFSPTAAAAGLGAIGDFVFRVPAPVSRIAQSTLEVVTSKLQLDRIAVIYDSTDVFSASGYMETVKTLAELGVETLGAEAFATGQTDFTDALTRINHLKPNVILVWTRPLERVSIPVQGRQLGIPYEIPFLVFGFASSQIGQAGPAAEGLITGTFWSHTIETPENRAFIEKYRVRFGDEPDLFAAEGYVCVQILAAALRKAGSTRSELVRDALATIELPTIVGRFAFDENGDPTYPAVLQVVRNGRFEMLGN